MIYGCVPLLALCTASFAQSTSPAEHEPSFRAIWSMLIPLLVVAVWLAGNVLILWKMGVASWLRVFFFQVGAVLGIALYAELDANPLRSESGNWGQFALLLIGTGWALHMAVRRAPQAPT